MNFQNSTFYTHRKLFVYALLVSLFAISNSAIAFDKMGSIGISTGYSQHSFEVEGYEAVSKSDSTFSITVGWDVTDRISLESTWFHLGKYEFRKLQPDIDNTRNAESSITGWGLDGLFYLVGTQGIEGIKTRRGVNLYAKLGGSIFMGDFYFGSIDILRDITDGERLKLGLGMEYAPPQNNFALRGEINTYNDDFLVGSLSLLWRWGRH